MKTLEAFIKKVIVIIKFLYDDLQKPKDEFRCVLMKQFYRGAKLLIAFTIHGGATDYICICFCKNKCGYLFTTVWQTQESFSMIINALFNLFSYRHVDPMPASRIFRKMGDLETIANRLNYYFFEIRSVIFFTMVKLISVMNFAITIRNALKSEYKETPTKIDLQFIVCQQIFEMFKINKTRGVKF